MIFEVGESYPDFFRQKWMHFDGDDEFIPIFFPSGLMELFEKEFGVVEKEKDNDFSK